MITTDFVAKNQGAFFFNQRTAAHVCANTKVLVAPLQRALYGYVACNWMAGSIPKTNSFTIRGKSVF